MQRRKTHAADAHGASCAGWLYDSLCRAISDKDPLRAHQGGRSFGDEPPLSLGQFGNLHRAAIQQFGDEFLALPCSGDVPPGTFRLMCQSMLSASTIGSAMRRGITFHQVLRGSNVAPELRPCGDRVGIGFASQTPCVEAQICGPDTALFGLLIWHGFLKWLSGYRLTLHRVELACPDHDLPWDLLDMFNAPIMFHATHSQLVVDQGALDLPVLQSEETLTHLLRSYPESFLDPNRTTETTTQRVLNLFKTRPALPMPGVDAIAYELNISVSSLHRRLRSEDTSIQILKDTYRIKAVKTLLADKRVSLTEVASRTGFSEPSSFFRTFRRWTGMTPKEFRLQLEQDARKVAF